MSQTDNFLDLFAPETPEQGSAKADEPWKVMLVDDEVDIHAALHLALEDILVEGRRIHLLDAQNSQQAKVLLNQHPDIALILLDVVMETEHAGLDFVRYVRHELGNRNLQIVLVTGQPGYAPERTVITEYEIDGYRLKSELTSDRIFVSVYAALRTYQAEINLAKSEEQLRLVLDGAELGYWDWNIGTGSVTRNERWATMLGYSHQEIQETTQQWTDFIHPEDREKAWQSINDVVEDRSNVHRLEYRMLHKDGSTRWILDQARVMQRNAEGKPSRMCGTHSDITLRKQSEIEYRTFIQTTHDGFWTVSIQNGYFIDVNQAYCDMIGYSREELLTMAILDIEANESAEQTKRHIQDIINGQAERFESRHKHKNGKLIDVEISAKYINEHGGIIVVFLRDISERKKLEAESRNFESIIYYSNDAVISKNLSGIVTSWNPAAETIFGYTAKEMIGNSMLKIFPADRVDEEDRILSSIKKGEKTQSFETIRARKDGKLIYVSVSISPIYDSSRNIIGASKIARDITEMKRAEEALKLASLVYQISSEAMMIVDAENHIISVNPAFIRVTGYALEEVLGKDPKILSSGRQDKVFYQAMWHEITHTGNWKGEIWNRRKNGDIYAESLAINTLYDEQGTVVRRVGLFSDITEKKQSEELIWQQANFDFLTGLPNRNMAYVQLDAELKKAYREGQKLALLFIDLDRFKEVNDSLGHEIGDVLLKEVAQRMRHCVRESDVIARLGGDEFVIILSGLNEISKVSLIAETILEKLTSPFLLSNELIHISASIGITIYPDDAQDSSTLLKNADQAMYVAKRQGRNSFQYFLPELQESANIRLRLANDMHGALSRNEFQVYFQPIVELASGKICKAEALLRWQHPTLGLISPEIFIPIAEETGQINKIGDWVFQRAAILSANIREHFEQDFQISVNKSPVQFRQSTQSCRNFLDFLASKKYPGQSIAVEITEGLLMEAREEITAQLLDLRDQGIQVSLDDFGTGYSSLSYLQKFDIDYIKIDKSFIANLTDNPSDITLCEAMIVMAHKLEIKVIAEGVETPEQLFMLQNISCDYGQGYLWSKPLPEIEFEKFIAAAKP